jgi:hypothetical protein
MSRILGNDFLELVKRKRPDLNRQTSLFPDFDDGAEARLIEGMKKLFEVRHILCHEVAHGFVINWREASYLTGNTVEFLPVTEAVAGDLLGGSTT